MTDTRETQEMYDTIPEAVAPPLDGIQEEYDPNAAAEEPAQAPTTVDPGLDGIFDEEVDLNAAEKAEADTLLPPGTYDTVPVLSATPYEAQTGPNTGRRGFRMFGEVLSRKPISRNGAAPAITGGRLGFRVSPERRDREDGTPDLQTRLWAQAIRAYTQAAGAKPTTNRDVVEYLKNYPVGMRLGQIGVPTESNPNPDGDPGNIVYSIFPVRGERAPF